MARLIALKQTAPERFLARFDTGEELRTTLAVVTDYHLSCGKELTEAELDALRAASERSRCRQRALRIIGTRAMSVKELTDRLKEKGETPDNAEDAAAWLEQMHLLDDAQYAAMCVRRYAAKGYGVGRIRSELYRRGIPREAWDDALHASGALESVKTFGHPTTFKQKQDDGKLIRSQSSVIEYYPKQNLVVLSGRATIWQDSSHVNGERIEYNTLTQKLKASTNKSQGGRVKSTFIPQELKSNNSKK